MNICAVVCTDGVLEISICRLELGLLELRLMRALEQLYATCGRHCSGAENSGSDEALNSFIVSATRGYLGGYLSA